jgi:hypothetical protein
MPMATPDFAILAGRPRTTAPSASAGPEPSWVPTTKAVPMMRSNEDFETDAKSGAMTRSIQGSAS